MSLASTLKSLKDNNVRALAALCIDQVAHHQRSLTQNLPTFLAQLPPEEHALLKELCFGSLRWFIKLESFSKKLLQKPIKAKDNDIFCLLLVGLYQIRFMRTSQHAILDQTVEACETLNKPWAKKLINAILRRFIDEQEKWDQKLRGSLHFRFSHPEWLIDLFRDSWPEDWKHILDQNNDPAPMTIRVNQQHYSRSAYLAKLKDKGIECTPAPYAKEGIYLNKAVSVQELPGFNDGACSVQDEAAQLAAHLLDLKPHQRVLDACCAPGGKLCHIKEVEPKVHLIGLDSEERRLQQTYENLQRLKMEDVSLLCAPAQELSQWWDGEAFDRILVDAPCSGTGVIRRHPDIKMLRNAQDIAKLATLQYAILKQLWQTLKPNGRLVFATCSVIPEENEQVIQQFLTQQSDAKQLTVHIDAGQQRDFGRQLFPQPKSHDGFFYACLQKLQSVPAST